MNLIETDSSTFFKLFPQPRTAFGLEAFNALNVHKAEAIKAFVLEDLKGKPRLGVLLGLIDGLWRAPYSAPFAEIAYNRPETIETCLEFAKALKSTGLPMRIILAPDFYDAEMLPLFTLSLSSVSSGRYDDFNYSYDLAKYPDICSGFHRNAQKNYRHALRSGFDFIADASLEETYGVIRRNREENGYPLAMSLEQVKATSAVIDMHCFLLRKEGRDAAAALVYRLNPRHAMVVYWGDVAEFRPDRPMNLLAHSVFEACRALGYETLDIGPSSSQGIPDPGLCSFKESLGCTLTSKSIINY